MYNVVRCIIIYLFIMYLLPALLLAAPYVVKSASLSR